MASNPESYPYDTVVYITDTIDGQGWQGSGVLISPDEVLTASHVVYSSTDGTATNIVVTPAYDNGSDPFGSTTGTMIDYSQIQDPNDVISNQQTQFDYAVIKLAQPFTGPGTMGLEANFAGGTVNVSGYPAVDDGQMDTSVQSVSLQPNYSVFDGTSLGAGSSGGPVWITGSNGEPEVVGLVSSETGGAGSTGYFVQLTTAAEAQIEAWVDGDSGNSTATASLSVVDTSTGATLAPSIVPYAGPVSGIQDQYINVTTDSLDITATTPNWFILGGSGMNAITVSSGTNVLDGGTGSNFLVGGSGTDTFFVDDRGATANIWSSVVNFHAGDAATLWGISPADFNISWINGEGAPGYSGLTLHANVTGRPTASLTLGGFTEADLSNGTLSVSFGADAASGSNYMYVHDNG